MIRKYLNRKLIAAIRNGKEKSALTALKFGADPNACDERVPGDSALLQLLGWRYTRCGPVCPPEYPSLLKALLECGADVHVRDRDDRSPLDLAVLHAFKASVLLLLDYDADINATDKFGSAPLMTAAWNTSDEMVQILLEHGADPNQQENEGKNALYMLLVGDRYYFVQVLRERVASVVTGITEETEYAEHLKKVWADFDIYRTPEAIIQWRSIELEHLEAKNQILRRFIARKAKLDQKDKQGRTSLHYAARYGNAETIRLLLEAGANIHLQDNEGHTPLHDAICAFVNDIENIEMLLRHHADVNARLHNGATPLDLVIKLERIMKLDLAMECLGETRCAEMIQLLRQADAKTSKELDADMGTQATLLHEGLSSQQGR